ncbi:O-antigen ligase family protein [Candidatus Enterococcus mansonii]|uniref:O-antigen ligase-related domain-containing protein n=1 Tax=Candidatus Enterococcus mansonii TaxID=1834181 RepID=A0ABU8IGY9_9ENTE
MIRSAGPFTILPKIVNTAIFTIVGLLGIFFICCDLWQAYQEKKRLTYEPLLVLFIIVAAISSIINIKYGYFDNLQSVLWQGIIFFIVYNVGKEFFEDKSFFSIIHWGLIIFWFILVIASIFMFLINFQLSEMVFGGTKHLRLGFIDGRLFGIFVDPNYASMVSIMTIVLSMYQFLLESTKKWIKVFLGFNVFFQLSYISMSGSRSGLLVLMCIVFLGIFYVVFQKQLSKAKNIFLTFLLAMVLAVVSSFAVYFAIDALKVIYMPLFDFIMSLKEHGVENSVGPSNAKSDKIFERPDSGKGGGDISNLRFAIWKSGMELFKTSWLFGTSPRNMIAYAKDVLPDTYIATNRTMHNAYLNTIVSTGILGTIPLFAFYIKSLISIIKTVFKRNAFSDYFGYYVLCLVVVASSSMFLNELIFVNTANSFLFWLFLGRLVGQAKSEKA